MDISLSQIIKSMHVEIQRGLRKSVDVLHALAKNSKKEIEFQKEKYTSKICNHCCNCHLNNKPASKPAIEKNSASSQKTSGKKKQNKNKNEQRKKQSAASLQKQDDPVQNNVESTQMQQELQQNIIQHQQQQSKLYNYPDRIYTSTPLNQTPSELIQNLANATNNQLNNQKFRENLAENPKPESDVRENMISRSAVKNMLKELEDKLSTYVKCVFFDKRLKSLSTLPNLEKIIFKRQLKTLVEIESVNLAENTIEKFLNELAEDIRKTCVKEQIRNNFKIN